VASSELTDASALDAVDENGVAVALEKRWLDQADTELTMVLDTVPVRAGIDPLNKLVDRDPDDNVVRVLPDETMADGASARP
jgi:ABC-2 type transport system permease protein